jgi:arylsulfatase A-like enzyme
MKLNRRDFLKLSLLLPLTKVCWPQVQAASWLDSKTADIKTEISHPNILILVFDTLAASHMSLHGYHRETTPNLSRFADQATVYHRHYSPGNFTTSGTASLLTGAYPWSHRGMHLFGNMAQGFVEKQIFTLLTSTPYHRVAFTHNPLVTIMLHQFRGEIEAIEKIGAHGVIGQMFSERFFFGDFDKAFWGELMLRGRNDPLPGSLLLSLWDKFYQFVYTLTLENRYKDQFPDGIAHNYTGQFFILDDAIDWIADQILSLPQPYLAYFHLWPPHEPYTPRQEFTDLFDDGWSSAPKPQHFFHEDKSEELLTEQWRHYDQYLAYADAEFGRLYDHMQQHGVLDDTLFIFTSDHGQLFERGIHGHITPTLYEPLLHIPLLISQPGQKQRQDIYSLTSSVDVLPTLLSNLKQPIPTWCEGQVLPAFTTSKPDPDRSLYALEAKSNSKNGPLTKCTLALIKNRHKLIHYLGYQDYENEYELYDLEADPEERINLFNTETDLAGVLRGELQEKLDQVNRQT